MPDDPQVSEATHVSPSSNSPTLPQGNTSTTLIASSSEQGQHNPGVVYLASLAHGSRRTMQHALNCIAEILGVAPVYDAAGRDVRYAVCPWSALRYEHTTAIRAVLQERYAATTGNKMLCALRRVLKEARRLGQMDLDTYANAVDLAAIHGEGPTAAAGREVVMRERAALLDVCSIDPSPQGRRDAALIAVAYACGLRRAELVALDLHDVDQATGTLLIQGKRNKRRSIPIDGGARDALEDWLQVRGMHAGPVFVRIHKGGNLTNHRLTAQAVYYILQQRTKQAGVEVFSPHDLRRTFAGDLLDAGVDLVTVQQMMGHVNVNTTARYDRRGERAKRQAARLIHVPYRRRK